ncbi:hypothetical protein Chor_016612 [Crotalus horridus]
MPRPTAVTVTVATLFGIAAGGLAVWKVIQRRKHNTCITLNQGQNVKEREKKDISEDIFRSSLPSPTICWLEEILEAKVIIVSEVEKWNEVEPILMKELECCLVLGIDCEWVSVKGKKAKPVSLLQLATCNGLCLLLRLPQLTNGGQVLPKTLLEVLADGKILKVGVGCWEDASKLFHDYSVTVKGTVDLRYLALRHSKTFSTNGLSLKSLAEKLLQYSLDKSLHLCCSNWEAEQLTQEQIDYAARDAQVSMALFLHLVNLSCPPCSSGDGYVLPAWEKVMKKCQGLVDVPFRGKNNSFGDDENPGNVEHSSQYEKLPSNESSPINQQVKDPRKHKRKPLGVGYSARKNIVPHEYRKHFPIQMKDHNSHDVLLLCTACHALSNYYDNHLKQQLAEEFSAPIGCEEGVRLLEDPTRRLVRSAARALVNADSLPAARKEELLQLIRDYFASDTVSPEMVQEAAGLETRIFNENYVPHGLKVVQSFAQGGLYSLMGLEKRWRQHFLDVMQPKHLPAQWSVDHNHDKLIRKYGETLQIELS